MYRFIFACLNMRFGSSSSVKHDKSIALTGCGMYILFFDNVFITLTKDSFRNAWGIAPVGGNSFAANRAVHADMDGDVGGDGGGGADDDSDRGGFHSPRSII